MTLLAMGVATTTIPQIAPQTDKAVVVEAKKEPKITKVKKSYNKKNGEIKISFKGKNYKTWIIVDDDEPFYKYFKGTGTHTWKMYDSAMKKGHVYHFTIAAVGKNYTFIKSKKVTMKIK